MEILVTDVTEMSGNNYCVAGWDATRGCMIRPLPGGGHWPQSLIVKHQIRPGTVLTAEEAGKPTGKFPHLTEDTPIALASIGVQHTSPDWMGADAPKMSASASQAFNGNLHWNKIFRGVHQGVYVPTGTQCHSLAAVKVAKADISFCEPFGKLLAVVDDGSS